MFNKIDLKEINKTVAVAVVLRDTGAYILGSKDYDQYATHVQSRWALNSDAWDLLLEYYEKFKPQNHVK